MHALGTGGVVRAGRRPRETAGDAPRGDSRKNAGAPDQRSERLRRRRLRCRPLRASRAAGNCAATDEARGSGATPGYQAPVFYVARPNSVTLRGKGEGQDGVIEAMTADAGKTARKPRSIEDEIARTAAKLKKLQDQQREMIRRERERNHKAVLELLRAEGLDEIPAEQWKERLEAVKVALAKPGETPVPAKPAQGMPPAAVADGASV